MTTEELEHIQAVCRGWLRQPDTSKDSRLTIPAGGALSRAVEVKISALLTFDNVLVMSAVDAETGGCYTKLIGRQGERGEIIDTPLDQIAFNSLHQFGDSRRQILRQDLQDSQDIEEQVQCKNLPTRPRSHLCKDFGIAPGSGHRLRNWNSTPTV